ncbi:protein-glutamate methylesterase/protein-glutamine glutaminase [Ectobacillus ponti]|uniref:Protein-glutamate methylesterase/protein-glutamine glutaminase n=1 Tax=Ectobacillus ponti TaxID=2961894 RepID=A0AA41XBY2_9BACI|nr:chemotaxis response regulator protein-glutamate methylesterase [Ectobacillus ponti]MCP8969211.1 chemotaxis response regulator protein-glutamate methylesterase [Ectobacillus ponti]
MSKQIRVLVVDDSLVFREVIARGISSDPAIQVVAKATDPFEARDYILQLHPDLMICDVEMPKMNGIEFIRRLLPQYSLPVLVVSTVTHAVFDAMNAGAVDFVPKPNANSPEDVRRFIQDLIAKIKIAVGAKIPADSQPQERITDTAKPVSDTSMIAVGASTGGTEAFFQMLQALPASMPGIVVVQHIPPVFSNMFAQRLNQSTPFSVKEAQTGDYIEPGKVLIAPGDMHMRVKKDGVKYRVECYAGEKISGHRPSVDVLFESVAREAGRRAVGVILTGMGYDGAKGLLAMRRKGARTIGQDEASSVVYGMPKAAFNIGAVEKQASLAQIPQLLHRWTTGQ